MSTVMIRAEQVGKSYRLGQEKSSFRTLRDTVATSLSRLGRGRAQRESFWALQDVGFEMKEGEVVG